MECNNVKSFVVGDSGDNGFCYVPGGIPDYIRNNLPGYPYEFTWPAGSRGGVGETVNYAIVPLYFAGGAAGDLEIDGVASVNSSLSQIVTQSKFLPTRKILARLVKSSLSIIERDVQDVWTDCYTAYSPFQNAKRDGSAMGGAVGFSTKRQRTTRRRSSAA